MLRCVSGLLFASAALAQTVPAPGTTPPPAAPAPAPQPAPLNPVLVKHLYAWEAAMKEVNRFAVEATQTKENTLTKRSEKNTGTIWVMKPNLARMNLKRVPPPGEQAKPEDFMGIICDGRFAYYFDGSNKSIREVPVGETGTGNMLFDVLKGMTAQQLVNRFDVKLLPKDDANYLYFEIKPRNAEDKAEFAEMTLVLCNDKVKGREYMPRMVRLSNPNGQETETWDFPAPQVNPENMKPEHFQFVYDPNKMKDWRMERVPVVKPTSPNPLPPGTGTGRVTPPGTGR